MRYAMYPMLGALVDTATIANENSVIKVTTLSKACYVIVLTISK